MIIVMLKKKRIATELRNLSLRKKLGLLTVLTIVITFTISLIGMHSLSDVYDDQLYQVISDGLYHSTTQLSKQIDALDSLSLMTLASPEIQSSLTQINQDPDTASYLRANTAIARVMSNYVQSYSYMGLKAITIDNGSYYHNTDHSTFAEFRDYLEPAKEAALEKKGGPAYTFIPEKNVFILSRSIRQIEHLSLAHLGDMFLYIDMDTFMGTVATPATSYESSIYLLFSDKKLVYSSGSIDPDTAMSLYENASHPYQLSSENGTSYFYVSNKLPGRNMYLISALPYDTLTAATTHLTRRILFIFIAAMIVLFLINNYFLKYTLEDYNKLVVKMKNIRVTDDFTPQPDPSYADRTDELGMLHNQFDMMCSEIHSLIQKNYVNEILTKEAQLNELKAQINPHFLYNTLETINWRAKAIHEEKISAMTEALGSIFRATLDTSSSLVVLSYEISLVNSYMLIQEIRFEDRLSFELDCQNDLEKCLIPPMTIQPLLENSIKYGMENTIDTCRLIVDISRNGDIINITVSNEGSLFEDDLLDKLRSGEIQPHGHGIGILNIDRRIKLLFGEGYGLSIYNKDEFAVAQITLPYTTEMPGEQDTANRM